MPHPTDQVVRDYHQTLDELHNVDRILKQFDAHQKRKQELEQRLESLREVLAGRLEFAEVNSTSNV